MKWIGCILNNTFSVQVVTGGHYDVDCRLEDADGTVLYKEMKKQYDSFTFTAAKNGTHKFCFSNEFSTFTHKTVYFDFQVGEDPPLFPNENRVTALTQVGLLLMTIAERCFSVQYSIWQFNQNNLLILYNKIKCYWISVCPIWQKHNGKNCVHRHRFLVICSACMSNHTGILYAFFKPENTCFRWSLPACPFMRP